MTMFGNHKDSHIFSTVSYLIKPGEFSKSIIDKEKLKKFQEFCKKENISRQDFANEIGKNEYHIFEPCKIVCGSKETFEKIYEHLKTNMPSRCVEFKYKE